MKHKFSIVTPSYNQLAWLSLASASVRDQITPESGFTVEHLIQDALTPGIYDAIKSPKHDTIDRNREYTLEITSEKDSGMYDAVNRGLRRAKGNYVAYLNCDEQYLPGALNKVARFFENNPNIEMVFGDVLLVDRNCEPIAYRRPIIPNSIHTQLKHLCTLTSSTFFRNSLLKKGLLFNPEWRIIGDAEWILRCIKAGVKMALINEPLSAFAITGNNLSSEGENLAKIEQRRLQTMRGAAPLWLGWPSVIHHRLHKLLAGAYIKRNLEYQIFSIDSPLVRKTFSATKLGHSWPNNKDRTI